MIFQISSVSLSGLHPKIESSPALFLTTPQFFRRFSTIPWAQAGNRLSLREILGFRGQGWRPMNEESSVGENLPGDPTLVSAKIRRLRRMAKNYASKSAQDKEELLLHDSERFGVPPWHDGRGPGI
jgi:hypothetical protein